MNGSLKFLLCFTLFFATTSWLAQKEDQFVIQTGHSSIVNKLVFSESGAIFASAGLDNKVILWETASGKQLRTFWGHKDQINDIQFMNGDSVLISCSNDSSIKFWNTYTGSIIDETKTTFLPTSFAVDRANKCMYITAKILYKYDFTNKELSIVKSPKRKPYTKVLMDPNGGIVFGGLNLGHFYRLKDSVLTQSAGSMLDVRISSQTEQLYLLTRGSNILSFDYTKKGYQYHKTLRTGWTFTREGSVLAINDSILLTLNKDNVVTYLDPLTGKTVKSFITNYHDAKSLALHPNGEVFITGADDGKIFLWDIKSGALLREFKSNSSAINFAKFSKDDESIVIGYNSGLIRIWNLTYGGTISTHKFQLTNAQAKKGWKYQVLSLESQDGSEYKFKVVLTKPYPGISYYKECRYYDFVWNLEKNTKVFTEKFVKDYDAYDCNFESIVEKQNLLFQNDSLFILAEGNGTQIFKGNSPDDLGFVTPHSNAITSIDYDLKRKLYLTASWDGQILLYNSRGTLINRLVNMGTDDFVIIDTENYYYATKGSLQYVGFTSGHRSNSFQKYDLFYNRPDLIYQKFPYGNPSMNDFLSTLHEKRMERHKVDGKELEKSYSSPVTDLLSLEGQATEKTTAAFKISVNDAYGIKSIQLKIEGVPVYESGKAEYLKKSFDTVINVDIQSGINKLDLFVQNIYGVSAPTQTIFVKCLAKPVKPNLYFVGIGVSNYKDTLRNLKYASKDIADIEKTIKKSKVFNKVYSKTLFNKAVNSDSLGQIDAFLANANVNDVVIVYFAGHGLLNKDLDYFLATYDTDFFAPENRAIPYQKMEEKLLNCNSRKKLLFIDACHSGELDKDNLLIQEGDVEIGKDIIFRSGPMNLKMSDGGSLDALKVIFADLKENNGITVISSAGGADYAVESDVWQNGAFTHCLIEGLKKDKSDLDQNGVVTISDLLQYLQINVPLITHGYQLPTYRTENIENDFVIWRK